MKKLQELFGTRFFKEIFFLQFKNCECINRLRTGSSGQSACLTALDINPLNFIRKGFLKCLN